jgi:hypothetical protein
LSFYAARPVEKGLNNIAFAAYLQLADITSLLALLIKTDRIPEAALLARTYAPSQTSAVVKEWKKMLEGEGKPKIAKAVADPEVESELFEEGWEEALRREEEELGRNATAAGVEEVLMENGRGREGEGEEEGEDDEFVEAEVEQDEEPSLVDQVEDKVEELATNVKELVVGNDGAFRLPSFTRTKRHLLDGS